MSNKKSNRKGIEIPKELIGELYINQNLSIKEILPMLNMSKKKFRDLCNHYGIHKSREMITYKMQKTMIENWGVSTPLKSNIIKDKMKRTCLERYGVEYVSQSPEIRNKMDKTLSSGEPTKKKKRTCLERYGVEHVSQSTEIRNKIKKTCIERYGVEVPSQNKEVQDKMKRTCLERYGVESYSQLPEVRKYINQKIREVYNTGNPQRKCRETMHINKSFGKSKDEEEIYEILLTKFSKDDIIRQYSSNMYPYPCDFYIKSLDLYIEYQGSWVHGNEPFNSINELHQERLNRLISKNTDYHNYAIKIWTERDPLKRQIAKENNLNFLEFFNMEQFNTWFNQNCIE